MIRAKMQELEEGQDISMSNLFNSDDDLLPTTIGIAVVITPEILRAFKEERMWESNGLPRT